MAIKEVTIENVNQAIANFLKDIGNVGASAKGDMFDTTVADKIRLHLNPLGLKYISTESWTSKSKYNIYAGHAAKASKKNFDFSDLPEISDNGEPLNLMLVDKPNGSQQWPDLLLIFNGVGLPIEVKSSKEDKIVWNSGLPRTDGLYVFNCYGISQTTYFLGQHALTEEEQKFLLEKAKLAKEINSKMDRWGFYARNMFNSDQSFFENPAFDNKVIEAEMKIEMLDVKEGKDYEKYLKTKNEYTQKYEEGKVLREAAENEVKAYVKSLTWDTSQKTNFDLTEDVKTKSPKKKR